MMSQERPENTRQNVMIPEEYKIYLNTNYPNRPTCCFCKNKTECPYGNSPFPLAKRGKCCGECNNAIILIRLGFIPINIAKKHKKELGNLYNSYMNK